MGTLGFLRNRSEQLADHLRAQIQANQLVEPLPSTRDWAGRLGVSCMTLQAALRTLQRDGLLSVSSRRGVSLNSRVKGPAAREGRKAVRILYRNSDYPEFPSHLNWFGPLSQRLQPFAIQLTVEKCTDARLRSLAGRQSAGEQGHRELLLLQSLSEPHQRMFSRSGRPCLIIGYRAQGVSIPFVAFDLEGAIRHATHRLLRRGFNQLHLIVNRVRIHAVQRQCDAFLNACAEWRQQPVAARIVHAPLAPGAQLSALKHFAARAAGPRGIIVIGPVTAGAVMTTLQAERPLGLSQTEVVVIDSTAPPSVVFPMPTRYSASMQAWLKILTHHALRFFEQGHLDASDTLVPIELVQGSKS